MLEVGRQCCRVFCGGRSGRPSVAPSAVFVDNPPRERPIAWIDGADLVSQRQEPGKDRVPGAIARVAAVTLPERLSLPELDRHIPPRDPAPISVDDALDRPAVIPERPTPPTRRRRQHRLDQSPISITEERRTRHPYASPTHHETIRRHDPGRARSGDSPVGVARAP
jgi:hypothetical protein